MAAMKTSMGRLYMLFSACLPQNEKVKKRVIICQIIESNEYNELKSYTPFTSLFQKLFSKEKLSEYSIEKLNELIIAMPKIIPLIENIFNAINYGNAIELTSKDIPDFTSVKSMDCLASKLRIDQANPNVTNIKKENFLVIFSEKTIKNPTEVLKSVSASDIQNPIEAVKKRLEKNAYCIKTKDITAIQERYAEQVSAVKEKILGVNKDKWKIQYKKWGCICAAILILTIINRFEFVTGETSICLTVLSLLLLIVYFFIG